MADQTPVARAPARPVPLLPIREQARRVSYLPVQLTSFVGRKRELAMVQALLRRDDVRLVTLTGPGGIGKTRLALHAAAAASGDFADGVVVVTLAPLREAEAVGPAITLALGAREYVDRPVEECLAEFLRELELLLVLDNFEHVIESGPLLTKLLSGSAGLKVLVTSRERLRLTGEHDLVVPALGLPDPRRLPMLEQLGDSEAVRLFVERAGAVSAEFALTETNAAVVAAVCARLDGLPLAIELAAARVGHLPPEALAARLVQRLPLLIGGARDQPPRLRTMHDAIAWSFDLLTLEEQRLFRRLAIFDGGFTLKAAEAVAQGLESGSHGQDVTDIAILQPPPASTHPSASSVLDLISALVDKSLLLVWGNPGGEPRYAMQEMLREFGLARLTDAREESATRAARAAYFLALAEQGAPELIGPAQANWLGRFEAEHTNFMAVLDWLLHREQVAALRMATALWRYWDTRGHLAEGRTWLDRALNAAVDAPAALRAAALHGAGTLAFTQSNCDKAEVYLAEGVRLWTIAGERAGLADSLGRLGDVVCRMGDFACAEPILIESLDLRRQMGDERGVALSLKGLGVLLRQTGDLDRAASLCDAALALFRDMDDTENVAYALADLGLLASVRGQQDRATTLFDESLRLFREVGEKQGAISCLEGIASVAVAHGWSDRAVRLLAAANALRQAFGIALPTNEVAPHERDIASLRAALGDEAFADAWSAGQVLTLEQAAGEAACVATDAISDQAAPPRPNSEPAPHKLTPREFEVLRLLAAGQSDKEIAAALAVSYRTVTNHVASILAKLGINSRVAAATYAVRHGIAGDEASVRR